MDARLDSTFESSGGFWLPEESTKIHGRLRYDPTKGLELELVQNPTNSPAVLQANGQQLATMFGNLVDGTLVTLAGLLFKNTSIGLGIGSTTTLHVEQALFGHHVADLNQLLLKRFSVELSSLSDWACISPVNFKLTETEGKPNGFDLTCRRSSPICVTMPNRPFDIEINYAMRTQQTNCSFSVTWSAAITVIAHDSLSFTQIQEIAWQCQNLMSLLIGERLSIRMVTIVAVEAAEPFAAERVLKMVYEQVGNHDQKDVHSARMLLPYDIVNEEFPAMVENWFGRSEQMILATNIFFGSQSIQSLAVNVKFLEAAQAVESYHRSLGTGLYMAQAEFDAAIQELSTHLPDAIEGDHRHSLKNRLKYGNEYSLRKRLAEMFNRLPEAVRQRIAGDVSRFIAKVVDTRNYYTHYDQAAQANAFDGGDAYIAAERLSVLVVANLLHDLGVKDESLLRILERHHRIQHWMSQALTF